jgi:hypothetical protein
MDRRRLAAVVVAVLTTNAVHAQGGYTTEKRAELGMTFSRARDYEAIPIRPSEQWIVLYYAEKEAFREDDRKRFRPELRFVWIDHDPEPELAARLPEPSATDDDAGTGAGAGEGGDAKEPPKPIDSFEAYVAQKLTSWDLGRAEPFVDRYDNVGRQYDLRFKTSSVPVRGHAFTFSNDERTIGVYGFCAEEDADEQLKIWTKMLDKAKLYEPVPPDDTKLQRFYARKNFTRPEYRIKVRNQLVDGWKADDTENYILAYSTKDEPLIRLVMSELEAIREEYVRLFPPVGNLDAVSTVRVCADEAEYRKYGGPAGSGGYWSAPTEELVFFDYENVDGEKGTGKANSRLVLYHEAFHQYVYYAIGEIAPHSWFNEGMGDYFGGAVIKGGKVKKIGVNPWRIELIQYALTSGGVRFKPERLSDLLEYTQAEFYQPARRSVCYAQAWSLIYFLKTSKEALKHPVWSTVLDVYFDALQNEYASQIWGKNVDDMSEEELEKVQTASRDAAVKKAFSDVDLFALEDAWREYTLGLKVPR